MDITLHIIEEYFEKFMDEHHSFPIIPDPELVHQLKKLGGDIVTHSLLRTYYGKYTQENWPEVLLYFINGFINYCNRAFKLSLKYNKKQLLFINGKKPICQEDLVVLADYRDIFSKYISVQSGKILLDNGNYICAYWAIPKYDENGIVLPYTHISFVDIVYCIDDLYKIITNSDYSNCYVRIKNIAKKNYLSVKKFKYGICIELY